MNKYNQPVISIAVLPFRNISSSEELNYFALGLSEDIITDLSKYSSLQVISAHSSFSDEGKASTALLMADYLVICSFRQTGSEVRINAQLLIASNESIV